MLGRYYKTFAYLLSFMNKKNEICKERKKESNERPVYKTQSYKAGKREIDAAGSEREANVKLLSAT